MVEPMLEADWLAPFALDVRVTIGVQGRGRGDPTYRADDAGAIWRTSLTPDGPGTIRVLPTPVWVVEPQDGSASTRVRAQASVRTRLRPRALQVRQRRADGCGGW